MIDQWSEFATGAFTSLYSESARMLPRILGVIGLLVLGIAAAYLVQRIVRGLLQRTGVDRLASKTAIGRALSRLAFDSPVAHISGFIAFWIVLAIFLVSSADVAGLPTVSRILGDILLHLPPYMLAAVLLLVGISVAQLARRTIEGVGERSRLVAARPLAGIAYWLIISLAVVVAFSGLGPDFTIITAVTVVLLASIGLGAAGLLVTGSRDVARNTVSGVYVRRSLRVGQRVRVGEIEGSITAVGQVSLTLREGRRTWLVPYDQVVNTVVEVFEEAPE